LVPQPSLDSAIFVLLWHFIKRHLQSLRRISSFRVMGSADGKTIASS
jgi:hypothetical protein